MLVAVPLALVCVASSLALVRWPARWAQVLIWALVLQNAVVIVAWKVSGSNAIGTDLLYAKEVVVAGGGLVAGLLALREARAGRLPVVLWLAVAFGALCLLWVPLSYARHEGLDQIARGLRSLVYPVLLLAIGVLAVPGPRAVRAVRSTLWWSAVALGASAVVERSLVPLRFWVAIGLDRYWVDVKGESPSMLNGALPWNFYVPLDGAVVRRAFGIMTDPLDLSYFLLLPLALAAVEVWRVRAAGGRWPALPLAAAGAGMLGVGFSLSRTPILVAGALVVAAPAVAAGLAPGRRQRVAAWALVSAAAFGVVLVISAVTSPAVSARDVLATAPIDEGSIGAHLASLGRLRDVGTLLTGHGLGTAGYLSARYAASGLTIGYEDPYADAAAQIGLAGGLLLFAVFALASARLLRLRGEAAPMGVVTGLTLGAITLGGVLSGQLEVVTSLGATCLFAGMTLSLPARERSPAGEDEAPAGSAAATPARRAMVFTDARAHGAEARGRGR